MLAFSEAKEPWTIMSGVFYFWNIFICMSNISKKRPIRISKKRLTSYLFEKRKIRELSCTKEITKFIKENLKTGDLIIINYVYFTVLEIRKERNIDRFHLKIFGNDRITEAKIPFSKLCDMVCWSRVLKLNKNIQK